MKKKKYYAVKVGYKPGVYKSWDECKEQVKYFSGSKFKSFSSYDEAINYVGIRLPEGYEYYYGKYRQF